MTDEMEEADYRVLNCHNELSGPPFAQRWDNLDLLLSTVDKMIVSYANEKIESLYFHLGEASAIAERVRGERSETQSGAGRQD